jgi:hypothetical protein
MHHQRPGRARRQCCARGDRHGRAHAPGHLRLRDAHRLDADRAGLEAGLRHHRLPGAAATRPSSGPTPSPTSRASTRTACSSTARPTRSCAPRTSAGRRTSWCWASIPAATPSRPGWPTWASWWTARSSSTSPSPLQGTGRQEARDLRRGPAGADVGRGGHPGAGALQAGQPARDLGDRRDAACPLDAFGGGAENQSEADGDGPVDASFKAPSSASPPARRSCCCSR